MWLDVRCIVDANTSFTLFSFFSDSNMLQQPVEVVVATESEMTQQGYCLPTTARNVKWNWTKPGETAILPCPLGTSGMD